MRGGEGRGRISVAVKDATWLVCLGGLILVLEDL